MAQLTPSCYTCKHSASDPDDIYCGHEKSLKVSSGFGQGLERARSSEGVCGPKGKLYEKCTCRHRYCPRHGKERSHG